MKIKIETECEGVWCYRCAGRYSMEFFGETVDAPKIRRHFCEDNNHEELFYDKDHNDWRRLPACVLKWGVK